MQTFLLDSSLLDYNLEDNASIGTPEATSEATYRAVRVSYVSSRSGIS